MIAPGHRLYLCDMRLRGLALAAVLMTAWAQQAPGPGTTSKQAPEQEPLRAQDLISVDVTRVDVLATVTDKRGRFVTDLNKDDFELI